MANINKLKMICITAISTALFVVLTMCVQTPIFENYYLCLGYVVMAVCLYSVDTFSGTFVGTAGVILYCLLTSGLRGMPGWALGNLVIGIMVGLTFKLTRSMNKSWMRAIVNFISIAVATTIGILIIKSFTECLLYAQPMLLRMSKNIFALIADVVVLECSLPICIFMDKYIKKALKI